MKHKKWRSIRRILWNSSCGSNNLIGYYEINEESKNQTLQALKHCIEKQNR